MSTLADQLERQARTFAAEITDLLNGTVTNGTRLSAALQPETGLCWVGRGITAQNLGRPMTVPLVVRPRARAHGHLLVAHVLQLDPEGLYLTVTKSLYTLYTEPTQERSAMVFHYDYVREPDNAYPAAHFQIAGQSEAMQKLSERASQHKELHDFHFPVGGRRFRPSLEDVVEFLIVEGLVESRPGSLDVIEEHRSLWEDRQLRAAVRRNPESARAELALADSAG